MKLSVRNLTKIYHSESEGSLALSDISIEFPETGFVVITGESGSGKTTLLNVLSGFTGYEEGSYFIDGVDFLSYSNLDIQKYQKNDIGFVFQDYHLIEDFSVIDNLIDSLLVIGVNYKEAKRRSIEILKTFGLEDKQTDIVRNLSGGQKQKIAIARAMLKEPPIILCDEPTANLDGENGIRVFEIMKEYAKNHLVIITTHNYEDAKDYVTESIRLYRGKLTMHETVVAQEGVPAKNEDKKTNFLPMAALSVKNHIPKTIMKFSFLGSFIAIIVFLLTLFASNIDDASTKVLSREMFNNINETEILLMHDDHSPISTADLDSIREDKHIEHTQLYGHATEMNYLYREGIDYEFDVVFDYETVGPEQTPVEFTRLVFTPLKDELYLKDYTSFVGENDIINGKLPSSYNEVVANNKYKVGDTITVYFSDPVIQGRVYLQLDFVVSGIFSNDDENLYFSTAFLEAFDYMQYYSVRVPFKVGVEATVELPKETIEYKDLVTFIPIYKPSLGDDEVVVSSDLSIRWPALYNAKLRIDDSYLLINGERVDVDFDIYNQSEEITGLYLYVGKNIYQKFIEGYTSSTARAYADTYSYLDDALASLNAKGYETLNPYRACSTKYDSNKQSQRTIILIVSLVLEFLISFVYFVFGYLFEKSNTNSDMTLYLLGASSKKIKQAAALKISLVYVLSLIFGIALYFILAFALQIPFIQNINTYFRFYHLFIVAGISLGLSLFIWWRYVSHLPFRKGGKK